VYDMDEALPIVAFGDFLGNFIFVIHLSELTTV
jgi:hypothetical protein